MGCNGSLMSVDTSADTQNGLAWSTVMWKRVVSLLLIGLLLGTIYLAVVDVPQLSIFGLSMYARLSMVGLAVIIAIVLLRTSDIEAPKALGQPYRVQLSPDEIASARKDVSECYGQQRIDRFFRMLTDLPSHLVRVNEEAELEEQSLRVATRLNYQLSSEEKGGQPETLLVPLATPEKGTLIDDFSVVDGGGNTVTTLSQHVVRGLLAIAVETLFLLAHRESNRDAILSCAEPKLSADDREVLDELVKLVCHVGQT